MYVIMCNNNYGHKLGSYAYACSPLVCIQVNIANYYILKTVNLSSEITEISIKTVGVPYNAKIKDG